MNRCYPLLLASSPFKHKSQSCNASSISHSITLIPTQFSHKWNRIWYAGLKPLINRFMCLQLAQVKLPHMKHQDLLSKKKGDTFKNTVIAWKVESLKYLIAQNTLATHLHATNWTLCARYFSCKHFVLQPTRVASQ